MEAGLYFQFTTSQGGRRREDELFIPAHDLSIHDLTRRSTIDGKPAYTLKRSFNSRPHKEVDFGKRKVCAEGRSFNSRPHKEVDSFPIYAFSFRLSFNSRPHKEVDDLGDFLRLGRGLSIHDLTRRSTVSYIKTDSYVSLSIHDLTRRSTSHLIDGLVDECLSIHDLTRRST